MTKKFFSIFLLATSMVASVLSAAPLRIINGSAGEVSDVKLVFNGQDEINARFLQPNQASTTDFPDNITSIKIYTITYINAHGIQVTENFKGEVVYLPADRILGSTPITITQNEDARKAAEETAILNQIATKAKHARDQVVESATAAKDWIVGTSKSAAHKAKVAANAAANTVADRTQDVEQEGAALRERTAENIAAAKKTVTHVSANLQHEGEKAVHTAQETTTEAVHTADENAQQLKDRVIEGGLHAVNVVKEKGIEIKHAAQETVTEAVHTADEILS